MPPKTNHRYFSVSGGFHLLHYTRLARVSIILSQYVIIFWNQFYRYFQICIKQVPIDFFFYYLFIMINEYRYCFPVTCYYFIKRMQQPIKPENTALQFYALCSHINIIYYHQLSIYFHYKTYSNVCTIIKLDTFDYRSIIIIIYSINMNYTKCNIMIIACRNKSSLI